MRAIKESKEEGKERKGEKDLPHKAEVVDSVFYIYIYLSYEEIYADQS